MSSKADLDQNQMPTLFSAIDDDVLRQIEEDEFYARERLGIESIGYCACSGASVAVGIEEEQGFVSKPGASVDILTRNRALQMILDNYAYEHESDGMARRLSLSPAPIDIIKRYGSLDHAMEISRGSAIKVENNAIVARDLWNIAYGSGAMHEYGGMESREILAAAQEENRKHRLKFASMSEKSKFDEERAKMKKQAKMYDRLNEKKDKTSSR